MRIAITGATGLLGRNLLFEIIKQNLFNLSELEVIALGRDQKAIPLEERLDFIIKNDGCDYIGFDKNDKNQLSQIAGSISPIAFDLTADDLGISTDDITKLKKKKIDYFFHAAALTDFRSSPKQKDALNEININGTNRLLELIKKLNVGEIVYIGSAYSSGAAKGLIRPDYVNIGEKFRNYYEKTKLIAEINFRGFAKANNIKYRIFRPIGICGRLIEKPTGAVCKYDIFYGWALFFLKQKLKHFNSIEDIYDKPFESSVRILINFKSGLNIVPVDYAAKLIYAACILDDPNIDYHLVNDIEIPHKKYVKIMLDAINVTGYNLVQEMPVNLNDSERLYYKSVGKLFTPYVVSDSVKYDTGSIEQIRMKIGITCPLMTEDNFRKLTEYAKSHYFGLQTGQRN